MFDGVQNALQVFKDEVASGFLVILIDLHVPTLGHGAEHLNRLQKIPQFLKAFFADGLEVALIGHLRIGLHFLSLEQLVGEEVLLFNDILSDHDETIDGLFFDQQRSSVDNISSVDSFGSGALLPDNVLSNSMPTVTALTAGASPEIEELEQMRQGFSDHSVFY